MYTLLLLFTAAFVSCEDLGFTRFQCDMDTSYRFYPDFNNCRMFYQCENGYLVHKDCAPGTFYNPLKQDDKCDWERNVICAGSTILQNGTQTLPEPIQTGPSTQFPVLGSCEGSIRNYEVVVKPPNKKEFETVYLILEFYKEKIEMFIIAQELMRVGGLRTAVCDHELIVESKLSVV